MTWWAQVRRRFPALDFDDFHRRDLPARLAAGNGRLAAADLVDVPPIAFQIAGGPAYTYRPRAGAVDVVAGADDAETIVALAPAPWSDFVHELRTAAGLAYAGELSIARGGAATLFRWEPALRAMFHGRPVLRAGELHLRDGDEPLDLTRRFSLADPAPAVRRFLDLAGFVVLGQVFSEDEVAELRDAVDALVAQAAPGDRRSWWARDAAGQQVLCRLIYAGLRAPRIAALDADPRVARLAALAPEPVRSAPDRMDGHAVILKRRQIVDGLADLPWHVDCGLGGHPIMCPVLQLSVYLDPATPETGNLRMLAGSWRYAKRVPLPDEEAALPVASVVTAPGDCTLHYGDTMHAAPPPSGDGPCRRSIVMSFYPERLYELVGPGQAFNDVLLARDDGHVGSL